MIHSQIIEAFIKNKIGYHKSNSRQTNKACICQIFSLDRGDGASEQFERRVSQKNAVCNNSKVKNGKM